MPIFEKEFDFDVWGVASVEAVEAESAEEAEALIRKALGAVPTVDSSDGVRIRGVQCEGVLFDIDN